MAYALPPISAIPFVFGDETPADMIVDGILSDGQLGELIAMSIGNIISGAILNANVLDGLIVVATGKSIVGGGLA